MNPPVTDIEEVVRIVIYKSIDLRNRNVFLEKENTSLRARLLCYKHTEKDSRNSIIPSSQESLHAQAVRRTRSLRIKKQAHRTTHPILTIDYRIKRSLWRRIKPRECGKHIKSNA